MKRLTGFFCLTFAALTLASRLVADAPPAFAGLEPLSDNGRSFCTWDRRLALHCLDLPGLLSLDPGQRNQALDRATASGFNAVSFEAPLFGTQGLCRKLGAMDPDATRSLTRTLEACGLRRLYAFPVLYPPQGVDGLVGTGTARAVFFAGRRAWGWQCWALRKVGALTEQGIPLAKASVVGGWILYRGPWPGGPPLLSGTAEAEGLSPTAAYEPARLRLWTTATVRFARRLGFRQELGLGLWPRADLPSTPPVQAADLDASAAGPPPTAAPSTVVFSAQDLSQESQSLDALPPVPGSDAPPSSVDDSAVLPAPPVDPWELEGLDWAAVEKLFTGLPTAGQLNFLEFTQDSEDWYGLGARLAQAAGKAEVPVLWRQDWRAASGYERGRHRTAPAPLAGLSGPWPDDAWPSNGGALWAPPAAGDPKAAPFRVQNLELKRKQGGLVLEALLSRPGKLTVEWGKGLPLDHEASSVGAGVLRRVKLGQGIPKGAWFLVRLRVESPRYGVCLLRTRWIRAPL